MKRVAPCRVSWYVTPSSTTVDAAGSEVTSPSR
jgi:hypothetical protein